jgi:hypothetical protein
MGSLPMDKWVFHSMEWREGSQIAIAIDEEKEKKPIGICGKGKAIWIGLRSHNTVLFIFLNRKLFY